MLSQGLGGIEQAVVDYSEAIAMAGYTAHAVIDTNAAITSALSGKKIAFSMLSNKGAWDIFAVVRLKLLLNKLKADIVIAHGNRALSLLAYAAGKCPIIAVMHNYKIKCNKASHVFCPTQALVEHVKRQGVAAGAISLIPNMVRLPEQPAKHSPHTPLVIGAMGRFVSKKGFDVLLNALALLKQKNVAFQVIIGGKGEEETALRALCNAKGLNDRVKFTGWIIDKHAFWESIDIFCLPSQHEPFGIVVLEAMAAGIPVISTDSEGPSEIIQNGINGVLVRKNNAIALADGLEQLLYDKKAGLLATNALKIVKNQYDIKVISNKLREVIGSIA